MAGSGAQGILGTSVQVESPDSDHPPSWEGPLPGTPPHWRRGSTLPPPSTPSHSASMRGLPPAGRSISSTQCWSALAYATAFSQGISLMSLHA